jgi:hypothetical protein
MHPAPTSPDALPLFIAFAGSRCLAVGTLPDVAVAVHQALHQGEHAPVLVFDDLTSAQTDLDLRGTPDEIAARHAPETTIAPEETVEDDVTSGPRGPGRPKLGVVAREVTLLPRHWEWLQDQPGGASVALRKLVDEARRTHEARDRRRKAQEAAYKFLWAMAGNLPQYEEASRALNANQPDRFSEWVQAWPQDIRNHALRLTARVFAIET